MRFLRFRLGCHHLRVNTGRWVQPPLPRRQRVCLRCHSACLDDETHCLLVCSHPTMVDAREKMHAAIPVAFRHNMATYAQFWGVLGRLLNKQTKNLRCGNRKGLLSRNDQTHHRMGPKTMESRPPSKRNTQADIQLRTRQIVAPANKSPAGD